MHRLGVASVPFAQMNISVTAPHRRGHKPSDRPQWVRGSLALVIGAFATAAVACICVYLAS